MNLLTIIAVVLIFIAALFVVAYLTLYFTVSKRGYEKAIDYIEFAIDSLKVSQANYSHIIKKFTELCEYEYQDPKRNNKAAKKFKEKYWREHALNNNLK